MMLGFLLARAGIDVVVLEKHADFLRDFRGDTVHPSTLELMRELGLLDEFLKLPHQKVQRLTFQIGAESHPGRGSQPRADALQVHRADAAVGFPEFPGRARRSASALPPDDADRSHRSSRRQSTSLTACARRRRTARSRSGRPRGRLRRAPFDDARARRAAVDDVGAPIDVLWFRISRRDERHRGNLRPHRGRPDDGDAQSRRLLAMRLRDPEGRYRQGQARRPVRIPRTRARAVAVPARPHRGDQELR